MNFIICPLDLPAAPESVNYASAIAGKSSSCVMLLHVIRNYRNPEKSKSVRSAALLSLKKLIVEFQQQFPNVKYSARVMSGAPDEAIRKSAAKMNADLIVMGSAGKGTLRRIVLGSTSEAVISDVGCPVMIIPHAWDQFSLTNIVYATDLKEDNLHSSQAITTLAGLFNANLYFVYISNKKFVQTNEALDDMTRKIRRHIKYKKMSGYMLSDSNVSSGIVKFIKSVDIDLIVMMTHLNDGAPKIFRKSDTVSVLHKIRIPLLVLRPSMKEVLTEN
ncbi:MAG: universal stress protein [Bacteroidetes bacterium]|nr:MAG: universal stress protein [Bacteroidota bacterium]REK05248.1 MAG: universal stress protein [Bacteroidota bacterium]REK32653.1 MAG: universal stress protein [Bacteroidota bacterium]REK48900.1 MAG: universal stress protein [Bacteroidota bacterium]